MKSKKKRLTNLNLLKIRQFYYEEVWKTFEIQQIVCFNFEISTKFQAWTLRLITEQHYNLMVYYIVVPRRQVGLLLITYVLLYYSS